MWIAYLIFIYYQSRKFDIIIKSPIFLILIGSIVGPGLTVNIALKNNLIGRARPIEIKEFCGDKKFTKVFQSSRECKTNCSFPSGHASIAFYFSIIAYFSSRRFNLIYLGALLFGMFIGYIRIILGKHFLSDVVSAGLIVLTLNHLTYIIWKHLILKNTKLL